MATVKFTDEKTGEEFRYYMDDRLHDILENKIIPALQKKDKDKVIAVDGNEGSGKTTVAFQIAKKVDPTFDLSRVVFNAEEFREAIYKAKKAQSIVFDEAFTGLSSRASLSGINKTLISLMMQMRQKNLFVIIVLPTFFLLDKYVALFRTIALIHVYESGGRRGYFRVYNRKLKKYLYLAGRQTYSYKHKKVHSRFRGRFYGKFALGGPEIEKRYRKKKEEALKKTEKNPMSAGQVKYREQRDVIMYLLRKNMKITYEQLSNLLGDYDIELSRAQIANICSKFGDKEKISPPKPVQNPKSMEIESKNTEKQGK